MDETGRVERLGRLVRRLLAPNPSPFTYTGTQTYIVGERRGGGDRSRARPARACRGAGRGARRASGSPRSSAPTPTATTARRAGRSRPRPALRSSAARRSASTMPARAPTNRLRLRLSARTGSSPTASGSAGDGWTLEAVATPGHTSNHLCLALPRSGALFTGDHVMGWSTTVVAPPDGDMADYMASLDRLLARDDRVYYPAHGPAVEDPHGPCPPADRAPPRCASARSSAHLEARRGADPGDGGGDVCATSIRACFPPRAARCSPI